MNSYEEDPEIYNIMFYMLFFVGFYVIFRVFTLNEPDDEDEKKNEHFS
jgi:hypothetical protein